MYSQKLVSLTRGHISTALAGLAVLLLIAGSVFAQESATGSSASAGTSAAGNSSSPEAEPETDVTVALEQPIDVDFQDIPLADALEYFRDVANVQIVIKNSFLMQAGVALDTPVSLKLKNTRAQTVLDLLLGEVSDRELQYSVRENLLIITTEDDYESLFSLRVYDVRDLLKQNHHKAESTPAAESPELTDPFAEPTVSSRGMSSSAMGGAMGSSRAMMGGQAMRSASQPPMGCGSVQKISAADNPIAVLLQSAVNPDTWQANGGVGFIGAHEGLLVIRQTDRMHRKVEELLGQLRSAKEESGAE